MRRALPIVLVAVVVALAIVAAVLYNQNQQTKQELASMTTAEGQARDRYAETIDAIAEIQDSLNAIALGDTGVGVDRWRGAGSEAAQPTRREALERIEAMKVSIARSKERINNLEDRLRRSGRETAGLRRLIANLRRGVQERETKIAELAYRIDDLRGEVKTLTTTVAEREDTLRVRDQMLEERRRDLATVYYVVGTKKELMRAGVVRERGGVLGLGQTLLPSPSPNTAAFNAVDTDMENVIRTDAEEIRVLSAQPATSYYLQKVNGKMEIHIVDPQEFRKIKQLVILET